MAVSKHICFFEIFGGLLLMCKKSAMRVYGAWIKRYCILCSKTYRTLHSCHNFPAGSWQSARAPTSVKRVYWDLHILCTRKARTWVKWNTAPSRADPVVVFPLCWWCPPQETSQSCLPNFSQVCSANDAPIWSRGRVWWVVSRHTATSV